MLEKIESCKNVTNLFKPDQRGREINCYLLRDCKFGKDNLCYPDVVIKDLHSNTLYNPLQERTMSLSALKTSEANKHSDLKFSDNTSVFECPVFYFIYDTQNYYHFLYDTLPYLISYLKLRKQKPNLKLLMNNKNGKKDDFYAFVKETLEILDVTNAVVLADADVKYKEMYISDSYTHGPDSNQSPREELFDLFKLLKQNSLLKTDSINTPKKIYVSRRAWLHNKFDNIGTNYTSRRVLKNENQLVDKLSEKGYAEVFPENMTMVEKINLFSNASSVVGIIGGGIANSVFLEPSAHLYAIISPGFLEINSRFIFCLNRQQLHLLQFTEHFSKSEFKKFMRVSYNGKYGEIYDINADYLMINEAKGIVSGWPSDADYNKVMVHKSECKKLDNGLNSAFVLDISKSMEMIQ
jgi:capsular polysaccharide biosynthesis protein